MALLIAKVLRTMQFGLEYLLDEIGYYLLPLICYWPGRSGKLLRFVFIKLRARRLDGWISVGPGVTLQGIENMTFGRNISISRDVSLYGKDATLEIGDNASIGIRAFIDASDGGEIKIGNNVLIAVNTVLRASNHRYSSNEIPIIQQGHEPGSITIGDDVWIAANCIILPDVRIASHSIIAAGSVVNKDTVEFSINGGVPAKFIRSRR